MALAVECPATIEADRQLRARFGETRAELATRDLFMTNVLVAMGEDPEQVRQQLAAFRAS